MNIKGCERCGEQFSKGVVHKMSWFNTDMICVECIKEEEKHPLFGKAKGMESEEVKKGNYNFPGLFFNKKWEEIKNIKA